MLSVTVHFEDGNSHIYKVPANLTVGEFLLIIRRKMSLSSKEGLFLLHDNLLLHCGRPLFHYANKNPEGELILMCKKENTFGHSGQHSG